MRGREPAVRRQTDWGRFERFKVTTVWYFLLLLLLFIWWWSEGRENQNRRARTRMTRRMKSGNPFIESVVWYNALLWGRDGCKLFLCLPVVVGGDSSSSCSSASCSSSSSSLWSLMMVKYPSEWMNGCEDPETWNDPSPRSVDLILPRAPNGFHRIWSSFFPVFFSLLSWCHYFTSSPSLMCSSNVWNRLDPFEGDPFFSVPLGTVISLHSFSHCVVLLLPLHPPPTFPIRPKDIKCKLWTVKVDCWWRWCQFMHDDPFCSVSQQPSESRSFSLGDTRERMTEWMTRRKEADPESRHPQTKALEKSSLFLPLMMILSFVHFPNNKFDPRSHDAKIYSANKFKFTPLGVERVHSFSIRTESQPDDAALNNPNLILLLLLPPWHH